MGEKFIICRLCGGGFEQLSSHLSRIHGISTYRYEEMFPGEPTISDSLSRGIGETTRRALTGISRDADFCRAVSDGNYRSYAASPERALRISEALTGLIRGPQTEEHRANISEAKLRSYREDPTLRERVGSGSRGRARTKEEKVSISEGMQRAYQGDPTLVERIREANTGQTRDRDTLERMSRSRYLAFEVDPTIVERISKSHRKNWENPDYAQERMASWHKSPNGPESALLRLLEGGYPGKFASNVSGAYQNQLWVLGYKGRFHPDVVRIDGVRQVIFSNGNHWHSSEDETRYVEDFRQYGFDCIVIWADSWEDIVVDWPKIVKRIEKGGS